MLRVLQAGDVDDLRRLLSRDPDAYVVIAERVEAGVLDPALTGGQTWGWFEDGERGPSTRLVSAVYVGANLMPIEATPAACEAFGLRLSRMGRRSSAVVGYTDQVADLWQYLEHSWGPLREFRANQPLMVIDTPPLVEPDSLVRTVRPDEIDILMPASVAMFEEEVGVSPISGGRHASYRARLGQTIRSGRAYARIFGGEVLFKAEIGAVSATSCQVQGVWVAKRLRGTGMAAPGIAAVVAAAMRDHAPCVSLYANSHNVAALRSYSRVGFAQVGTFATILF